MGGAPKRDVNEKPRQHDAEYPYEADGVKAILRDVYRLGESQYMNGDIDATIILTDLKMALDSGCLTPRMRQVVALYYFVGFTQVEISDVLGIAQKNVLKSIDMSIERISAEMDYGYKEPNGARTDAVLTPTNDIERDLFVVLNEIASGNRPVYDVDDKLCTVAVRYLAREGDEKAQEALRQRADGSITIIEEIPPDGEYPALTWEQMQWDDRRISYVSEVYPPGDIVGRRKVAIKLRDGDKSGNEWVIENRAMFSEKN
ncbi:hypothetical protein D7Z54_32930 [Salibacterium salarium]|uniref:RNA polymerase sigma-70 region 4 domain-containing protein n=1 Tax=Salibacterium salarium TaxID=284579 RepID=A0A428MSL8_9BACI|nr:sigma factor-like helix-turn-helix DNA-binding protein [Salibacterium salarium]RSL29137.1 hypothetical protein D7Z54_32930 [Salibacterium salarium]